MLAFPFHHGGSSHYRHLLEIGVPIRPWPHKDAALELMGAVGRELRARDHQLEFYQENMLRQETGHSNWQHGETYVVAGRQKALAYALSNAEHGGELLNECAILLRKLAQFDPAAASSLPERFPELVPMLEGGGRPLIVTIEGVRVEDLQLEAEREYGAAGLIEKIVNDLDNPIAMTVWGQIGFRLRPGAGVVVAVDEVQVEPAS
ncbi:hypothetical protein PQI07_25215 [Methylobacterium sp. 092160098-2]|uniref:hypothetical protein n=1 Tax=Methylobacterium sp. 092160098-2 TaxID=3025129 RepID=UPI002381B6A8|nr:hypothetical protein [Methylobacterium sp. 092160098-2]MDE4913973.1 hypothetical protein [Methylobacterium sp. 092160098-2]